MLGAGTTTIGRCKLAQCTNSTPTYRQCAPALCGLSRLRPTQFADTMREGHRSARTHTCVIGRRLHAKPTAYHGPDDPAHKQPPEQYFWQRQRRRTCNVAFRDRPTFFPSTAMTLALILDPSFMKAAMLRTRSVCSSEMCTRPSNPGYLSPSITKTPKFFTDTTSTPSNTSPTFGIGPGARSAKCAQRGIRVAA